MTCSSPDLESNGMVHGQHDPPPGSPATRAGSARRGRWPRPHADTGGLRSTNLH